MFAYLYRKTHTLGLFFLALAFLAGLLFSCSSSSDRSSGDNQLVRTSVSETAKAPATTSSNPCDQTAGQRIVSLSPTATEMIYAIGAGAEVVAVDEYSNYPERAPNDRGLSGFTPNVEAILGEEPDLVLVQRPDGDDEFQKLTDVGICVLRLTAAENLAEVYAQITLLGEVTQNPEAAVGLINEMSNNIEAILDSAATFSVPVTYFYELDPNLYSVTDNTFVGHILGLLGLTSIAPGGTASGDYPQLNEESILDANPGIIFLADVQCCGQDKNSVSGRAGWNTLTAVQQGNILELDADIASRWGPRIVYLLDAVNRFLQEDFSA